MYTSRIKTVQEASGPNNKTLVYPFWHKTETKEVSQKLPHFASETYASSIHRMFVCYPEQEENSA